MELGKEQFVALTPKTTFEAVHCLNAKFDNLASELPNVGVKKASELVCEAVGIRRYQVKMLNQLIQESFNAKH